MGTAFVSSTRRAALLTALMLALFGTASAYAQTTVTAAWDRNTDSYTAGYRVYYGTSPGSYQWSVDAGNQISAPITLTPGSLYYVAVRAYTAQMEYGPPSTEATVDLRAPAPTAQITATLGANNVATITWSTANATSATINGTAVALSGTTTQTVTAQTTFTLVSRAADGRTATASATVTPVVVPAPTAQITATLGANNVATVTWSTTNATSASINGQTVGLSGTTSVAVTAQTTFTLTARAADGRTATASATVTPTAPAPTAQITATLGANNVATVTWSTTNATSASINGQTVGLSGTTSVAVTAQTTFTLTARAADGRTATASASVTPTQVPAPTADITAALQDAPSVDGVSGFNAVVSWQTSNAQTVTINDVAVAPTGSTTVSITQTTTFTIRAVNSAGQVATDSATVTTPAVTAPGSPRNMTAAVSGSRATLSWQPPATGGAPSNYLIFLGSASGWSDLVNAYNVGNVLSVYGDLPRGTYYARSRASNTAGTSLSSNEVTFQIGRKLRSPSNLRAYWTNNRVTITWTASAADTTADVPTNYVLEAGTAPGSSNAAVVNVGNTTSFETEVNGGIYYVRVRAQNDLGESDPSSEIEIRTPGAPQAPTALMQSGTGPEVFLRWTAPVGGYPAEGYIIEAGSAPGLANLAVLQVGNVTTFSTTAPPGTYYVRVRAINGRGASLASNEVVVRR